jgi:mannose-1-phosphate guanylyltransferase
MRNGVGGMNRVWSIVLAGGEGRRLGPLTQQWLGRHRPKQYCTFTGTRSMLQHTLDRAERLTAPERKVTVIARTHREEAWPQLEGRSGSVILQPADRDTAAGIFLPLTYVRARDPHATVVIYPSDHFVYPEERFVELSQYAAETAQRLDDRLILLGAQAEAPEQEYGWIYPGRDMAWNGHRVRAVSSFLEKPGRAEAQHAMASGALWNTFVMAARVDTLWSLGWYCFPAMMQLFERLGEAIDTEVEEMVLESLYRVMPAKNFSKDLLQRMAGNVSVIELEGVMWSDWGQPDRIATSLGMIGKEPAFPLAYAQAG